MKKGILFTVICTIVLSAIVCVGFLFKVRYVSVEFLNNASICEATELLRHVDISSNTNIFSVDEQKIKDSVEKSYPDNLIEVVDVVRSFPDRITVQVRERTPVFKIKVLSDNGGYVVPDIDFQRYKVYREEDIPDQKLIPVEGFSVEKTLNTEECRLLRTISYTLMERHFTESSLPYFILEIDFSDEEIILRLFDGNVFILSKNNAKEDLLSQYDKYITK